MTLEDLESLIPAHALDELVQDKALAFASGINNDGVGVQLNYLFRGSDWDLAGLLKKVESDLLWDDLKQIGPSHYPEARLLTDQYGGDEGEFLLYWHAVVQCNTDEGPIWLFADDCKLPLAVDVLDHQNRLPEKQRLAQVVTNPETQQTYVPVWIPEERKDEYSSIDQ